MQKALILALLIGAFLLPRYVTAQENPGLLCPDGGTLQDHPQLGAICSAPAPSGYKGVIGSFEAYASSQNEAYIRVCDVYISDLNVNTETVRRWREHQQPDFPWQCKFITYTSNFNSATGNWSQPSPNLSTVNISGGQTASYCPSDENPNLRNTFGDEPNVFCWAPALDEPPEECEDIVGNCEPDPECFPGGNGMEVCPKDPDETCDSYNHNGNIYYDCPAGCGFIEGSLYCTTEPDSDGEIPDLSNCFKVATGWACPSDSPTPDDNIDNPEKPLPDMNKGDFKQVNIGIETRLDGTNDLLSDLAAIGKANAEGLADLNSKSLAGNKKLDDIIKNTGATVDALTGDGESADFGDGATFRAEIANALGITGEETIEDLTVAEIDLDDFKGEFSWSIGSSQCPQPRAINMLGRTFYMDWDPFCQAFTIMGYLILAAAYFFSTLIAFKGK